MRGTENESLLFVALGTVSVGKFESFGKNHEKRRVFRQGPFHLLSGEENKTVPC